MKCTKCGAEMNTNMKFCGTCGTPVPQSRKCPKCGADILPGAQFCMECGSPAVIKHFCIKCNKEIPEDKKFCPFCGANQLEKPAPKASAQNTNTTPVKKPVIPLTKVETMEAKRIEDVFYKRNGSFYSIFNSAANIYAKHPNVPEAADPFVILLASLRHMQEDINTLISNLGKETLACVIAQLDTCLTDKDLVKAEELINRNSAQFEKMPLFKCYLCYFYIEMYLTYNDASYLEKAAKTNESLGKVKSPLEKSHQLRVMSLLKKMVGEEIPPFDYDFCIQNNLYYRVLSDISTSGVLKLTDEESEEAIDIDVSVKSLYGKSGGKI